VLALLLAAPGQARNHTQQAIVGAHSRVPTSYKTILNDPESPTSYKTILNDPESPPILNDPESPRLTQPAPRLVGSPVAAIPATRPGLSVTLVPALSCQKAAPESALVG
jgi:hypothetical protein